MTDEEFIARAREVGVRLRSLNGDLERLAAELLKQAADRLEGRAAAQATEDSHD